MEEAPLTVMVCMPDAEMVTGVYRAPSANSPLLDSE